MAYNPIEASAYSAFKVFISFTLISNQESKRLATEKIEDFITQSYARQAQHFDPPMPLFYYFSMNLQHLLLNSSIGGLDIYRDIRPLNKDSQVFTSLQNGSDQYLRDIENFNHFVSQNTGNSAALMIRNKLEIQREKALSIFENIKNEANEVEYYNLLNGAYDVDRIKKPGNVTIYFAQHREVS